MVLRLRLRYALYLIPDYFIAAGADAATIFPFRNDACLRAERRRKRRKKEAKPS